MEAPVKGNRFRSSGSLDTMGSTKGFYSTNSLFMNSVGLSSNISSSTLRHTAVQFSFPKANRFHTQSNITVPTKVDLPSQLGSRTTTAGFGDKILFQHPWQKRIAEENPSPDRYDVQQEPGKDKLKRSFGLPFEVYSKTFLPYNKHQSPEVAKFLPGPGEYQVRKELGQHRYQYQLKGKGKMFNEMFENGVPSPDTYTPVNVLVTPSRFNVINNFFITKLKKQQKICLGIGEKKNPFTSNSFTPGPGRYELGSAFDKYQKRRELLVKLGDKRPFI